MHLFISFFATDFVRKTIKSINPFPITPFWNRPKFKEAADDNWNVDIKGF